MGLGFGLDPNYQGINRHTDHPNPFRPPSGIHALIPAASPYNIYKGNFTYIIPKKNWFEETSVPMQLFYTFKKGFMIGGVLGLYDSWVMELDKLPKDRAIRMIYTALPMGVAFSSFVAARSVASQAYEKMGMDGNSMGVNCIASLGPASVHAVMRSDWSVGFRSWFWLSIISTCYVQSKKLGLEFYDDEGPEGNKNYQLFNPIDGWKWNGWSLYDYWESRHEPPEWKKFADEDAEKRKEQLLFQMLSFMDEVEDDFIQKSKESADE